MRWSEPPLAARLRCWWLEPIHRDPCALSAAVAYLGLVRPMSLAMFERVTPTAWIGFGLALAFALWWIFAPTSVVRFYSWLGKRPIDPVRPMAIRVLGVCMVVGL